MERASTEGKSLEIRDDQRANARAIQRPTPLIGRSGEINTVVAAIRAASKGCGKLVLDQSEIESAIQSQVQQSVSGASSTGSFWGRVMTSGQNIEYRAHTLQDGTINVGTYYVIP